MVNRVYLGLGSNVGNRVNNIGNAVKALDNDSSIEVLDISSIYETLPYGNVKQENFLNCAVRICTGYSPEELFVFVKNVEKNIGRIESERWGPREIDIDILLYDDITFKSENLIIPHEDLMNRDFVVTPLLELEPDIQMPGDDIFLKELSGFEKNIIRKTENYLIQSAVN